MPNLDEVLAINDNSPLHRARFCIGVGAQRSGTTWVSRYLVKHPGFLMSPIKEMHVFDSLCLGAAKHAGIESRYSTALMAHDLTQSDNDGLSHLSGFLALADRVALVNTKGGYFRYFEKRLNSKHYSFGEITPEYALLSQDDYRRIYAAFPGTRFFYILRNPVDRYVSAVHYWARLRPRFSVAEAYIGGLGKDIFTKYTLYHKTLEAMKEALPADAIYTCFYEEMFRDQSKTLAALCEFLGIEYISPDKLSVPIGSRINSAGDGEVRSGLGPSEAQVATIREYFRDVYENLPELVGQELPREWTIP